MDHSSVKMDKIAAFYPWLRSCSKKFAVDSIEEDLERLDFFIKNFQEEIDIIKEIEDNECTIMLFEVLKNVILYFRWKSQWKKEENKENDSSEDSIRIENCGRFHQRFGILLSQLIYIGMVLSEGDGDWLSQVLRVIGLFSCSSETTQNALLEINKLDPKLMPSYIAILKHVLITNSTNRFGSPESYMKHIMLFKRLKTVQTEKVEKEKVMSAVSKMKSPGDLSIWLCGNLSPENIPEMDGDEIHGDSVSTTLVKSPNALFKKLHQIFVEKGHLRSRKKDNEIKDIPASSSQPKAFKMKNRKFSTKDFEDISSSCNLTAVSFNEKSDALCEKSIEEQLLHDSCSSISNLTGVAVNEKSDHLCAKLIEEQKMKHTFAENKTGITLNSLKLLTKEVKNINKKKNPDVSIDSNNSPERSNLDERRKYGTHKKEKVVECDRSSIPNNLCQEKQHEDNTECICTDKNEFDLNENLSETTLSDKQGENEVFTKSKSKTMAKKDNVSENQKEKPMHDCEEQRDASETDLQNLSGINGGVSISEDETIRETAMQNLCCEGSVTKNGSARGDDPDHLEKNANGRSICTTKKKRVKKNKRPDKLSKKSKKSSKVDKKGKKKKAKTINNSPTLSDTSEEVNPIDISERILQSECAIGSDINKSVEKTIGDSEESNPVNLEKNMNVKNMSTTKMKRVKKDKKLDKLPKKCKKSSKVEKKGKKKKSANTINKSPSLSDTSEEVNQIDISERIVQNGCAMGSDINHGVEREAAGGREELEMDDNKMEEDENVSATPPIPAFIESEESSPVDLEKNMNDKNISTTKMKRVKKDKKPDKLSKKYKKSSKADKKEKKKKSAKKINKSLTLRNTLKEVNQMDISERVVQNECVIRSDNPEESEIDDPSPIYDYLNRETIAFQSGLDSRIGTHEHVLNEINLSTESEDSNLVTLEKNMNDKNISTTKVKRVKKYKKLDKLPKKSKKSSKVDKKEKKKKSAMKINKSLTLSDTPKEVNQIDISERIIQNGCAMGSDINHCVDSEAIGGHEENEIDDQSPINDYLNRETIADNDKSEMDDQSSISFQSGLEIDEEIEEENNLTKKNKEASKVTKITKKDRKTSSKKNRNKPEKRNSVLVTKKKRKLLGYKSSGFSNEKSTKKVVKSKKKTTNKERKPEDEKADQETEVTDKKDSQKKEKKHKKKDKDELTENGNESITSTTPASVERKNSNNHKKTATDKKDKKKKKHKTKDKENQGASSPISACNEKEESNNQVMGSAEKDDSKKKNKKNDKNKTEDENVRATPSIPTSMEKEESSNQDMETSGKKDNQKNKKKHKKRDKDEVNEDGSTNAKKKKKRKKKDEENLNATSSILPSMEKEKNNTQEIDDTKDKQKKKKKHKKRDKDRATEDGKVSSKEKKQKKKDKENLNDNSSIPTSMGKEKQVMKAAEKEGDQKKKKKHKDKGTEDVSVSITPIPTSTGKEETNIQETEAIDKRNERKKTMKQKKKDKVIEHGHVRATPPIPTSMKNKGKVTDEDNQKKRKKHKKKDKENANSTSIPTSKEKKVSNNQEKKGTDKENNQKKKKKHKKKDKAIEDENMNTTLPIPASKKKEESNQEMKATDKDNQRKNDKRNNIDKETEKGSVKGGALIRSADSVNKNNDNICEGQINKSLAIDTPSSCFGENSTTDFHHNVNFQSEVKAIDQEESEKKRKMKHKEKKLKGGSSKKKKSKNEDRARNKKHKEEKKTSKKEHNDKKNNEGETEGLKDKNPKKKKRRKVESAENETENNPEVETTLGSVQSYFKMTEVGNNKEVKKSKEKKKSKKDKEKSAKKPKLSHKKNKSKKISKTEHNSSSAVLGPRTNGETNTCVVSQLTSSSIVQDQTEIQDVQSSQRKRSLRTSVIEQTSESSPSIFAQRKTEIQNVQSSSKRIRSSRNSDDSSLTEQPFESSPSIFTQRKPEIQNVQSSSNRDLDDSSLKEHPSDSSPSTSAQRKNRLKSLDGRSCKERSSVSSPSTSAQRKIEIQNVLSSSKRKNSLSDFDDNFQSLSINRSVLKRRKIQSTKKDENTLKENSGQSAGPSLEENNQWQCIETIPEGPENVHVSSPESSQSEIQAKESTDKKESNNVSFTPLKQTSFQSERSGELLKNTTKKMFRLYNENAQSAKRPRSSTNSFSSADNQKTSQVESHLQVSNLSDKKCTSISIGIQTEHFDLCQGSRSMDAVASSPNIPQSNNVSHRTRSKSSLDHSNNENVHVRPGTNLELSNRCITKPSIDQSTNQSPAQASTFHVNRRDDHSRMSSQSLPAWMNCTNSSSIMEKRNIENNRVANKNSLLQNSDATLNTECIPESVPNSDIIPNSVEPYNLRSRCPSLARHTTVAERRREMSRLNSYLFDSDTDHEGAITAASVERILESLASSKCNSAEPVAPRQHHNTVVASTVEEMLERLSTPRPAQHAQAHLMCLRPCCLAQNGLHINQSNQNSLNVQSKTLPHHGLPNNLINSPSSKDLPNNSVNSPSSKDLPNNSVNSPSSKDLPIILHTESIPLTHWDTQTTELANGGGSQSSNQHESQNLLAQGELSLHHQCNEDNLNMSNTEPHTSRRQSSPAMDSLNDSPCILFSELGVCSQLEECSRKSLNSPSFKSSPSLLANVQDRQSFQNLEISNIPSTSNGFPVKSGKNRFASSTPRVRATLNIPDSPEFLSPTTSDCESAEDGIGTVNAELHSLFNPFVISDKEVASGYSSSNSTIIPPPAEKSKSAKVERSLHQITAHSQVYSEDELDDVSTRALLSDLDSRRSLIMASDHESTDNQEPRKRSRLSLKNQVKVKHSAQNSKTESAQEPTCEIAEEPTCEIAEEPTCEIAEEPTCKTPPRRYNLRSKKSRGPPKWLTVSIMS